MKDFQRIGKVLVTPTLLEEVLLLPDGDRITDVRWNFEKQCVEFMMKSDSFEVVHFSEKIPQYNGMYISEGLGENRFKGWERVKND